MHAAKRRRLDGSPAFQNKPFRSPLPKAIKAQPTVEDEHLGHTSELSGQKLSSSSIATSSPNVEPKDSRKERSVLSIRLTKLRQSLDTAQQALEIEESNQDAELRTLIGKWRTVAQEAAEELFADAKERVQGMGGVVAWRRRMKEDARLWTDNQDERNLCHGDDNEQLEHSHRRLPGENMPSRLECSQDSEEDEESFTMDMMLRQMNIDLRLIGYDRQFERWVE
ncbi:hypothetical protein A1O3_04487 [Capronia epimyces CBS 606.96]|uniref:Swi5-dependent recombination DNA repair protein 1 n=1 Tax=Capronia epimyces CBS 606.96 TaxID=1182542 RepID=W9Y3Y5_9EURO|nr:uncharacterized protein A1O3_04487 [Capronia epimyces CBS 606.96]EXJ87527.1 hypothetical protein A1O3_04487 [Capronia epimyces CBS 606.96]